MNASLARKLTAETIGTALLLIAVVGSGIMAEQLAGGNIALALLANAIATGGALIALILTFGPVSGAHFNPVVTVALGIGARTPAREMLAYVCAQCIGAVIGVWLAHAMFSLPLLEISQKSRSGGALFISEIIATFGLLAVILSGVRTQSDKIPYAVAAYITGAYWFTSSTSFANPAVTLARAFTNTFAGIAPADAPAFMLAQVLGAALATVLLGWLFSGKSA